MSRNRFFKQRFSLNVLSLGAGFVLASAGTVYAGFEWVPPAGPSQGADSSAGRAVPVEPVENDIMTPMANPNQPEISVNVQIEEPEITSTTPAQATPPAQAPIDTAPATAESAPQTPVIRSLDMAAKKDARAEAPETKRPVERKVEEHVIYWQQERQTIDKPPAPQIQKEERAEVTPQNLTPEDLTQPPTMPKEPKPAIVERNVQSVKRETETGTPAISKIIMPEDAPISAKVVESKAAELRPAPQTAKDPEKQGLTINPYPTLSKDEATQAVSGKYAMVPSLTENQDDVPVSTDKVLEAEDSTVIGFGADMPLALALQQIVPSSYAFAFGQNVNPGALVSWEGGRPWHEVMQAMLNPLGLVGQVDENKIIIRQAEALNPDTSATQGSLQSPQATSNSTASADQANSASEATPKIIRRHIISDPGPAPLSAPAVDVEPAEKMGSSVPKARAVEKVAAMEPAAGHPATSVMNMLAQASTQMVVFEARKGDSLKDVLEAWAQAAEVNLVWKASDAYVVQKDVSFKNDFNTAVQKIISEGLGEYGKAPLLVFEREKISSSGTNARLIVQDSSLADAG